MAGFRPEVRSDLLVLLAEAADGPELVEVVVAHTTAAVSRLSTRDWAGLADRVRLPDGRYPGEFAWRCGYTHHHLGMYSRAIHFYEQADADHLDDRELAHLYACQAGTAWKRGDVEACEKYTEQALALAEATGDPGALAFAWLSRALQTAMEGDRHANAQAYVLCLEYAEASGDLLTQARVHNNLASSHLEEARYAQAIEHLQTGLLLNEATGHLSMQALLRINMAEALHGIGRLDEALLEAEAARAIWLSVQSPMADAWQLLGTLQSSRGNVAQAALAFEEAARLAEEEGDAQSLIPSLAGLAVCRVADDPAAARQLAVDTLELPAAMGHVPAYVAAGWVHLHSGDRPQALSYGERAVREAGRRRDLVRLAEALELCVLAAGGDHRDPRLAEAASIWESIGNTVRARVNDVIVARLSGSLLGEEVARQRLRALGVHDDAWGIAGPLLAVRPRERTAALHVHVLGTFVVYRDGTPVPGNAWTSRKARDILKILAVHDGPAISRDALAELLWPGETGTGSRLSVALSQLRSALDPDREHDSSHFVVADRATVRLDTERVSIDAVEFRQAAREALDAARAGRPDAVALLEAAAARHTGRLLDGDTYADWAATAAEQLSLVGHEVIRALAFALVRGEDPQRALPWLARLLVEDPYDEPTYQATVRLLVGERRHGEARRYYRAYALRMQEIDAPVTTWDELAGSD
ncbi:BTAD domain-containing putative transcriptional regulator [Nocardioides lianchengensis]|uniref:DNA-binding transcriptional activator of the SARP family n=1 Tax=Nocardioides lianchengensis TaxID=1045774 RepID=A0A1G7BP71_9ACTN|nr:BTAD domain-containing putative transcriptional regulator [Nocardioides lianchengensis]NYG08923.1 DNA-binding SARP family transcriptional activator [Nocardioides lianchengensis]SDE28722.1 DNA-binding transcriptional activator of the SARP family [Nocardioides lianchengensis]